MSERVWYKKWTLWAVVVFAALFIWGLARVANAGEVLLGVGAGATNNNDWIGQMVTLSDRDWYVSVMRVGGDDIQPDTWRFAVGYRVDWREDKKIAPFLRLGTAYWVDEPIPLISDHWSYDMSAGVRLWKVVDIEWTHNSTAGRTDFNKGNDMPFVNVVFSF